MRDDLRTRRACPGVSGPAFVGRSRELAALAEALAGPPAVLLVEGEAGVGKSRLVREFLASPAAAEHRTLVGVCPPLARPFTLGPFVDAVRQGCDGVAGLRLTALAGALRPLFPEWAADLPAAPEPLEDPTAARHRLFRAMAELIGSLDTTLLVIEDVHWADEATGELLLFLTSHQAYHRLSLLLTYRPEDLAADSPVLRLSSRTSAGTRLRLTLEPLDVAATTRMVSSMLDAGRVSDRLAASLHRHTDGLPLAVEETVRLLYDRADLVRRGGEWARRGPDEPALAATMRDAVLERVHRLGTGAQDLLRSAAVVTEPAGADELATVAGLDLAQQDRCTGDVLGSGLLVDDAGRLRFRHMLTATAIYAAIPPPTRRELHLRTARLLETRDPRPLPQLARHYRGAGEVARWSRYAEQAADLAIATGDSAVAVTLLVDLLAHDELPVPERARLARKVAFAALTRTSASRDLVRHVVAGLRTVLSQPGLPPAEQARIRNPLGRLLLQIGEFEAGRAELERAVPGLRHDPVEAARVMALLGVPRGGSWPVARHLRWLRRAATVAPDDLQPVDRIALTVNRATALLLLGEQEGWALAGEIPAEVPAGPAAWHAAIGYLNTGHAAMLWGHHADAARRLTHALRLARTAGNDRTAHEILITRAHLDWLTGEWNGLDERLRMLAGGHEADLEPHLEAVTVTALLAAARGDHDLAEQLLRQVVVEIERRGVVDFLMEPVAALARLRLAGQDPAEALYLTDRAVRELSDRRVWVWGTELVPVRVSALIASGRAEDAAGLVEEFARGLRARSSPASKAALTLSRGLVATSRADHLRAATYFGRAADAWDRLPRPYDALLAHEQQARCLISAGQADHGATLLAQAQEGLARLGARADAERIAGELPGTGAPARRRRAGRRGYGDQLSPREIDVVTLVVAGRTNREIAAALNRSPKTVATQVGSAMRKLGVTSRTALAVTAIDTGLVPAGAINSVI